MLENHEGKRVPEVTFHVRRNGDWAEMTSGEVFAGRTVVVFSLPGAFTPTCSSAHVPRFNELAPVFRANGVDEIVCISVNDAFVMDAWRKEQSAEQIRFLPDGNGEFTAAMGMLVDKADLGFGRRSWRYSMLVRDGVIEKMFIEPQGPEDPYEVSDADTMLRHLNPEAATLPKIALFTRPGCPYCARAKALLTKAALPYQEIVVGKCASLAALRAVTGVDTVPQVFADGVCIGDSEALAAWMKGRTAA